MIVDSFTGPNSNNIRKHLFPNFILIVRSWHIFCSSDEKCGYKKNENEMVTILFRPGPIRWASQYLWILALNYSLSGSPSLASFQLVIFITWLIHRFFEAYIPILIVGVSELRHYPYMLVMQHWWRAEAYIAVPRRYRVQVHMPVHLRLIDIKGNSWLFIDVSCSEFEVDWSGSTRQGRVQNIHVLTSMKLSAYTFPHPFTCFQIVVPPTRLRNKVTGLTADLICYEASRPVIED